MRDIRGRENSLREEKMEENEVKELKRQVDLASHEFGLDPGKRFFGLGKEIIPLLLFG